MSLYYNNEFWFLDKLNVKKCNADFELVRKLFVSNISNEFFSVEQLMKKFRRYGTIERIELQIDQHFVEDCPTDYPNYAYITFKEMDSAHKALKEKDLRRRPFDVQPANTWKQPIFSYQPTDIDYFGKLDDYSLMDLFDSLLFDDLYELAEVCLRFHSLIHFAVFKHLKGLTWNCNKMSVTKFRQSLLAHGEYVERVTFILPEVKDQKVVDRMVDLFSKYVNHNLVELDIRGLSISTRKLSQFKKIFQHLKVLKWTGWKHVDEYNCKYETFRDANFSDDVDLLNTCINLEKLTVTQPHGFNINSGAWLKLTNVHIGFSFTWTQHFLDFCINNPQISRLKIFGSNVNDILNSITSYLSNLEKLNIYYIQDPIEPVEIHMLITLQKLRILKFENIESDKINFFLQVAAMLPELEEFELIIKKTDNDDTHPHLTNLRVFAENAMEIKKFRLENYKLTEDVIMDMLRYNHCLEVLNICNCQVNITEQLILSMCRQVCENPKRGESGPLEVVVDSFQNDQVNEALLRKNVSKHIKLVQNGS